MLAEVCELQQALPPGVPINLPKGHPALPLAVSESSALVEDQQWQPAAVVAADALCACSGLGKDTAPSWSSAPLTLRAAVVPAQSEGHLYQLTM